MGFFRNSKITAGLLWGMAGAVGVHAQNPTGLSVVNAANYFYQIAPGSVATAFGENLPTGASASVEICTPGSPPSGCVSATVAATSSGQISFLVPTSVTANPSVVEVLDSGSVVASGSVPVTSLSPGIFTANFAGYGVFAGQAYEQNGYVSVTNDTAGQVEGVAVPASSSSGQSILILYGTGWKNVNPANVKVNIGNTSIAPQYIGPSHESGLDQLNVPIPSGLQTESSQMENINVTINHATDSTTGVYTTNTVEFCLAGTSGDQDCPAVISAPEPLCTEPLPYLGAPYAPHGIFVLEFPGANLTPVTDYIAKQPAVCGGNIFVVWSQVDQGNGNYNWSSVDNAIAPWTAVGKKVNFIVWGTSDSATNTATPSYVTSDPSYKSVTCTESGATRTDPVYFSAGYMNNYQNFIQAVLNRYGSNPSVAYMRFGLAQGGEAFPSCLQEQMAAAGVGSISAFDTFWENYISSMTSFEKSVQESVLNSSGRVVQLMQALNEFGNPPQYNVTQFEAQNAKSLGFGFGSQGLSMADLTNYQSGGTCTSDWCNNFVNLLGYVPLELQTIAPTSSSTTSTDTAGSLSALIPFALKLHTQIFELYIQDLQTAYDPTSQYYTQYSAAYQQALNQAANYVGYGSQP